MYSKIITAADFKKPLNLGNQEFTHNKYGYYKWLRENEPVHKGKMVSFVSAYFLTRYDDCVSMLKDSRFVRNRATATGGTLSPIPLPKSVLLLLNSMTSQDEPGHRRLRTLVHKGFRPRMLVKLEGRIEKLAEELLDKAEAKGKIDLMKEFAHPIPMTVIAEMVGVEVDDVRQLYDCIAAITNGYSSFTLFRTIAWDFPKATKFIRQLIERKRVNPADDILTNLIQAEQEGETLSSEELVAMVFLIIIAGYETIYNLITNAVYTLLTHPEQLARLRAEPELIDSAIEEVLRFNGPLHTIKPEYPTEDVTIRGVTIPKGSTVMPLLCSANHDPAVFEHPEVFDIARQPNRHLGFGMGIHYCLGAPLARLETKIALKTLLERNPNLRLAVPPEELELIARLGWHQYKSMPVLLG